MRVVVVAETQPGRVRDFAYAVEIVAVVLQVGERRADGEVGHDDGFAAYGRLGVASLFPPVHAALHVVLVEFAGDVRAGYRDAEVLGHFAELGRRAAVELPVSVRGRFGGGVSHFGYLPERLRCIGAHIAADRIELQPDRFLLARNAVLLRALGGRSLREQASSDQRPCREEH